MTAIQKNEIYSFPEFVLRWARLIRGSLLTFWCIQIGLWLFVAAVMAVLEVIFGAEGEILGIPGVTAFVGGILASFCVGVSLNGTYFALAVNFGIPRHRIVAGIWALGVLYGVALMLSNWLLEWLWELTFAAGRPVLNLVTLVPWWGWAAAILLPIAMTIFGSSIVRRFGMKGGIVLYFAFLAFCIVPSQMNDIFPLQEEQLLSALPWIFAVLGIVCGAAGSILLLQVNVKTG